MKTLNTKTKKEALKEGNSSTNQRIKAEFISKHVFTNVNDVVEYILSKSYEDSNAPFSMDDISNCFTYPELIGEYVNFEGGSGEDKQTEIDRLKTQLLDFEDQNDDNYETEIEKINEEIEQLENLENEPQEVFEWWAVSDYLAEKLESHKGCIIKSHNYWGRCTTGQAILLDYVITKICADMEILEGQTNSWA